MHWSCQLRSAISDIEVDHVKLEKKTKFRVPGYEKPVQFGLIFDFAYKMSEDPSQVRTLTRNFVNVYLDLSLT